MKKIISILIIISLGLFAFYFFLRAMVGCMYCEKISLINNTTETIVAEPILKHSTTYFIPTHYKTNTRPYRTTKMRKNPLAPQENQSVYVDIDNATPVGFSVKIGEKYGFIPLGENNTAIIQNSSDMQELPKEIEPIE